MSERYFLKKIEMKKTDKEKRKRKMFYWVKNRKIYKEKINWKKKERNKIKLSEGNINKIGKREKA